MQEWIEAYREATGCDFASALAEYERQKYDSDNYAGCFTDDSI